MEGMSAFSKQLPPFSRFAHPASVSQNWLSRNVTTYSVVSKNRIYPGVAKQSKTQHQTCARKQLNQIKVNQAESNQIRPLCYFPLL
jgi:hypothetical protein